MPYDGIKKIIKGFEDGDFEIKYFSKRAEKDESDESDEKENLDWLKYGTNKQFRDLKKDLNMLPDNVQLKIGRLFLSQAS